MLTKVDIEILKHSPCSYCKCTKKNNTYQNIGLHKWKHGFTRNNIFPLCKLCYIIRNGQKLNDLLRSIICIFLRIPVKQQIQFRQTDKCKRYDSLRICNMNKNKCKYCHSKKNLTVDKIHPKKGYELGNVQFLCWSCNRMKSNINETIFFSHLRKIYYNNYE